MAAVRTSRELWAALGALLSSALLTTAGGCAGPGLEPPWADEETRASDNRGGSGVVVGPPQGTPPPTAPVPTAGTSGDNEFGNAGGAGGATSGSQGFAGAGVEPQQPVPPVTVDPPDDGAAGAGGSGSVDPSTPSGGPSGAFSGFDFVPGCDTESPSALTATDPCRYALPDGVDPAQLAIASFDGAASVTLMRHDSALGCLLGDGFYVDATVMPPVLVLCSQTCATLSVSTQLVAIAGCAAP